MMSEDTITEGTERWAQRFIRHAATALYDTLSSPQRDFEAAQALKEQAHRLAHGLSNGERLLRQQSQQGGKLSDRTWQA